MIEVLVLIIFLNGGAVYFDEYTHNPGRLSCSELARDIAEQHIRVEDRAKVLYTNQVCKPMVTA